MFTTSILKFLVSALALISYFGSASATAQRMKRHGEVMARTNAERLRLGQPPLPPRSLFPSKTTLAARGGGPRPSGTSRPNKKCIMVRKKNGGSFVGYISKYFVDGTGYYKLHDDDDKCLKVKVPDSQGPFDLEIHNANGNEKYLGLAKKSDTSYAVPVKAGQSSTSSWKQNSNEGSTPWSQSSVWSKNGIDGLTCSWRTGPSSSVSVKTYIGTGSNSKRLYFATDDAAFKSQFSSIHEVVLNFVSPDDD